MLFSTFFFIFLPTVLLKISVAKAPRFSTCACQMSCAPDHFDAAALLKIPLNSNTISTVHKYILLYQHITNLSANSSVQISGGTAPGGTKSALLHIIIVYEELINYLHESNYILKLTGFRKKNLTLCIVVIVFGSVVITYKTHFNYISYIHIAIKHYMDLFII